MSQGKTVIVILVTLIVGFAGGFVLRPVILPMQQAEAVAAVIPAAAVSSEARGTQYFVAHIDEARQVVPAKGGDADRVTALLGLLVREAGKSLPDSVAEVREAVDFLRYYAGEARRLFVVEALPGPTGESNTLQLAGRGVFVCISPWNFPLAIFTGQIAAALMAGNAVLAKPSEQTPLVAAIAVRLLHEAGVPPPALQLLPGQGGTVDGTASAADQVDSFFGIGDPDAWRYRRMVLHYAQLAHDAGGVDGVSRINPLKRTVAR